MFLKKLKIILHCNYIYLLLFLITLVYSFIYICVINHNSLLNSNMDTFSGKITSIKVTDNLLKMELKGVEKIIANYYFKDDDEKAFFITNYELGDTISVKGEFSIPKNNTVPSTFNYKKYLERKNIYYLISVDSYEKIKDNTSIFYKIKNSVIRHISNYKSSSYLYVFILGSTDCVSANSLSSYQENGISHLLAISGMHISLLSGIIIFLLKKMKINEFASYLVTILFLIFYMFLLGSTASVSRSVIFFSLLGINKILDFKIETIKIVILTFCILALGNPNILFDIGFEFSFVVSFYLIFAQNKLKSKNYFISLFKVSAISFLVSLPITIYYFYQINFLSVVLNLLFVPFVSIIIFPFAIITFLFPIFDSLFFSLALIMEKVSHIFNQIAIFKLSFMKPSLLWMIVYYLFLTVYIYNQKIGEIIFIGILLFIQYFHLYIFPNDYFIYIDVGQGDSALINIDNKTILIDVGGKINSNKNNSDISKSLTKNTILPLLKSSGIKKIDYLVLTHGDYDHMGEAINLVENFKINKVIFNCGDFNDLERNLIKVLNKRKINYYSCIEGLNMSKYELTFLNTKKYDNENDNSSVIYINYNSYKFLFMGDASVEKEEDILRKYNLKDIDFLKVGHHGSSTSSSKEFINSINPKYSLISVGKNNRYGHPKESVLDNLSKSMIYRTDIDGSVEVKFSKTGYKIKNYSP